MNSELTVGRRVAAGVGVLAIATMGVLTACSSGSSTSPSSSSSTTTTTAPTLSSTEKSISHQPPAPSTPTLPGAVPN